MTPATKNETVAFGAEHKTFLKSICSRDGPALHVERETQ